jgi:hypothetical protein
MTACIRFACLFHIAFRLALELDPILDQLGSSRSYIIFTSTIDDQVTSRNVLQVQGSFRNELKGLILSSRFSSYPFSGVKRPRKLPEVAIVRATHICLRVSRIPSSKMSNRFPFWEDTGPVFFAIQRTVDSMHGTAV